MVHKIKYKSWNEIHKAVTEGNGVARFTMADLRDAEGATRLGHKIIQSIEAKMATLGMGHLPMEMTNRQESSVIVYAYGTPAAEVVQAVRNGLTDSVSDGVFIALARLNSTAETLQKVANEVAAEVVDKALAS